jgi:hypothetical protein
MPLAQNYASINFKLAVWEMTPPEITCYNATLCQFLPKRAMRFAVCGMRNKAFWLSKNPEGSGPRRL